MELVWNGMLTCDYERTRPEEALLGWDLYTTALIAWPTVLMGEASPYGRLRRPGIVDIDCAEHDRLTGLWHADLANPARVAALIATTEKDRAAASAALDGCGTAAACGNTRAFDAEIAAATAAFLRVTCTHIVNWLLPEQHWEELLTRLLSSQTKALTCLSALQLPDQPGHILAAHARHSPAPEVGQVAVLSRARAGTSRQAWHLAALLAAGNDNEREEIRALAAVLGWAATSEERRNELRSRYLTAVTTWCRTRGADPDQITTRDLIGAAE